MTQQNSSIAPTQPTAVSRDEKQAAAMAQSQQLAHQTRQVLPLLPTNMQEAWRVAEALAQSSLVPREYQGQPGNVLTAVFMGHDLGISPMQAMREIYVVNGRPSTSAMLKVALIRQSGLCEFWNVLESTDQRCTIETKRKGEKPYRHTYSLEDAKQAGLYPPQKADSNWGKRPTLMLRRRCASELADEIYSDVTKGLAESDETQEVQESQVLSRTTHAPPPQTSSAPQLPAARAVEAQAMTQAEPTAARQEAAPEGASSPVQQDPPVDSATPDAAEVLLVEIAAADRLSVLDDIATVAKAKLPKGARRDEVGRAINAKRAELKEKGA